MPRPNNPPQNRTPKIVSIPLDELRIDSLYQRDPKDPSFVRLKKSIVEKYDPALMHPLDVSYWDNLSEGFPSNWVYDGYCRLESARELHDRGQFGPKITCAVISVERPEQSRLFYKQTNRRGVSWPDKHRSRLGYEDPAALAIQQVIDTLGLTVGKKADVRAVQSLYSTVEWDRTTGNEDAPLRADLLQDVLTVAGEAWTEDGTLAKGLRVQYASSDRMIDALALLLSKFTPAEMPRGKLTDALHRVYPPFIMEKAARKTSVHGSNNRGAIASEILALYNRTHGTSLRKSRIVGPSSRRRGDS